MLTVRPTIRLPALFVDASRVLIEEHAEIELLTKQLNARMSAWGEESCRHQELHVRRRIDAYLRRYIREVNQLKATAPAASMASVFEDLLKHLDVTSNREAMQQLESLLASGTSAGRS